MQSFAILFVASACVVYTSAFVARHEPFLFAGSSLHASQAASSSSINELKRRLWRPEQKFEPASKEIISIRFSS